ncbi:MAG: PD-(D/E)XK nuclease family protein, partial [Cetobacterium sp.]
MSSFSSITRLEGCQRKALFGMIMGKYRQKSEALIFGTAFHTSLEKGLNTGLAELKKEGLYDLVPLLSEMWMRQTTFMATQDIEVLDYELDFEIPIKGLTEPFRGYIDGLAIWRDQQWLLEFKTARSIDVDHVSVDSQVTAYLWACRELGLAEPEGILYFVNQKSLEKKPVVLASGQLSTAKNQGCKYIDY